MNQAMDLFFTRGDLYLPHSAVNLKNIEILTLSTAKPAALPQEAIFQEDVSIVRSPCLPWQKKFPNHLQYQGNAGGPAHPIVHRCAGYHGEKGPTA